MSLQVWLPFNNNLQNNGLDYSINFTGSPVYGAGKYGQCRTSGTISGISSTLSSNEGFAFSLWWKISEGDSYSITMPINTGVKENVVLTFAKMDYSSNAVPHYAIKLNATNNEPQMLWVRDTRYDGGTWELGKWTHFTVNVINKDGTMIVKIYVNGEEKYSYSSTTYNFTLRPGTITLTGSASMQDFRLYNSSLSQHEIERDYCSLLIHYPLRDRYIENTTNLIAYPTPDGVASHNWDATLHPNAIKVIGWNTGYNGGVSNPTTTIHGYWNLIDNIPTMVLTDIGQSWIGVTSNSDTTILPAIGIGNQYTISFDARANVEGKQIHTGLYYTNTSGTSGFHDNTTTFNLTHEWKTYSMTKTLGSAADITKGARVYMYGHTGSIEGTAYVRNVQIEAKGYNTAYTKTIRENQPVYDCSGRGFHSEARDDLLIKTDSIRNSNYTYFTPNNAIKIPSPYGTSTRNIDEFSFAMWIKLVNGGAYKTIFTTCYGDNANANTGWFSLNTEGQKLWFYNKKYHGISGTFPTNEWHHVVLTYKNSAAQWYLDGEAVGNQITDDIGYISMHPHFSLGDSYKGSSWSGADFEGAISDFRFYGVAIPATAVKDLYNNSATVDHKGNFHAFEYVEV